MNNENKTGSVDIASKYTCEINSKYSNASGTNSSNSSNTKESILNMIQKQAKNRNLRKNESE